MKDKNRLAKTFRTLSIATGCGMLSVLLIVLAGWKTALLLLLSSTLFLLFLNRAADRAGGFLGSLIMEGRWTITLREQLAGELSKAKCLKSKKEFNEALATVNLILEKMPQHPEALFLKAEILREGFGNHPAARIYLEKILKLKSMPDETVRTWAASLLEKLC